ncbi:hypothetical protein RQP46_011429 [Phenoliferia psychrophenolica]
MLVTVCPNDPFSLELVKIERRNAGRKMPLEALMSYDAAIALLQQAPLHISDRECAELRAGHRDFSGEGMFQTIAMTDSVDGETQARVRWDGVYLLHSSASYG